MVEERFLPPTDDQIRRTLERRKETPWALVENADTGDTDVIFYNEGLQPDKAQLDALLGDSKGWILKIYKTQPPLFSVHTALALPYTRDRLIRKDADHGRNPQ